MNEEHIALEVHFSGRVQGVGFRYTACTVARSFDVDGSVENLADGRVRLVAEGRAIEVEAFVDALHEAMRGNIAGVERERRPATGAFEDFGIGR